MASSELPLLPDPETELDECLTTLENFLALLGFRHHTLLAATLSWSAFFLLAVALPLAEIKLSRCSGCEKFEIEIFELEILISRAVVAAVSLLCVPRNLRKYGIRKALFVDRCHGHMTQFRKLYIQRIRVLLIVQVVGILLCVTAAAKISHRAQSLGSIASRWHALVTCSSDDGSDSGDVDNGGNAESHHSTSISFNRSEIDLESADCVPMPTNIQLVPSKSSYQRRQAFGMYVFS